MMHYLTTSPQSGYWGKPPEASPGTSHYTDPRRPAKSALYIKGMVAFACSLPIRVAILAIRVLKAIASIFYAIFGTLSQDRAKNWKECSKELVRLMGSIAELLSGCLGVVAPPLAYRCELALYENESVRTGAFLTRRNELGGPRFASSNIRPRPEQAPATHPDGPHKAYVRPEMPRAQEPAVSAPVTGNDQPGDMALLLQQIDRRFSQENGDDFKRELILYITERLGNQAGGEGWKLLNLREIGERLLDVLQQVALPVGLGAPDGQGEVPPGLNEQNGEDLD